MTNSVPRFHRGDYVKLTGRGERFVIRTVHRVNGLVKYELRLAGDLERSDAGSVFESELRPG